MWLHRLTSTASVGFTFRCEPWFNSLGDVQSLSPHVEIGRPRRLDLAIIALFPPHLHVIIDINEIGLEHAHARFHVCLESKNPDFASLQNLFFLLCTGTCQSYPGSVSMRNMADSNSPYKSLHAPK